MAFFRRSRPDSAPDGPPSGRAAAPPSPREETPPEAPARPGVPLAERLRDIAEAVLPEDALEQALGVVVESIGAAAGALCFYDVRHEVLRLAVETGLSDEGCQRLRTVRRNDPGSWDMPLNGLLNRKVYLIETAEQNRYVPRLVPEGRPIKTVACLPLVLGADAVGSLILVSVAPRALGERDVQMLAEPLRQLGKMIVAVRQHAGRPPGAAPRPVPAAVGGQPGTGGAEHEPLADRVVRLARERDALAAEAEAARERAAQRVTELEAEVRRLATALDAAAVNEIRLREELQASEERRLAAANANSREALEAVHAAAKAREEAEAETERARTEATEARAAAERLQARVDAQDAELAAMRREHEAARQAWSHEDAERGRLAEQIDAERAARESLQGELAHERDERARIDAERAALETRLAGLEAACAAHEAALTSGAGVVEELRTERDVLLAERDGLRADFDRLEAELVAVLPPAGAEPAMAGDGIGPEPDPVALEVVTVDPDELRPVEVEPLPVPEAATEPVVASSPVDPIELPGVEPGTPVVVVLDAKPGWSGLALAGHAVVALEPDGAVAAQLAGLAPVRVIANLAAPGALDVLFAARAANPALRFWGCIADAEAGTVLPLGMVEPIRAPLDPDSVMAALPGYAARGGRIVMSGADVDALMSLRQAAGREGVGVSMAWDAKQVADLLPAVRPHVVLVDLELPRRDGYAILAGLSAIEAIPHAMVVGAPADAAAGFAAMLRDVRFTSATWSLARFVADVMQRSQEPPAAPPAAAKGAVRRPGFK